MKQTEITSKKAIVCINNKGLVGSVYVNNDAFINPESRFVFKAYGYEKVFRVKDIQFLMFKVPNKEAFNFLYHGQIYTTDSSNYQIFKERWDMMNSLSQKSKKGC